MIQSLEITNFQSHEETILNFHPGVNIIIGSSDSGKTSIIRTIRKLVWNRPSSETLRSHWGGKISVRLGTEEGFVTWAKDKVDQYTLVRPGFEDLVFKAFGTSVPEEVSRFLNLSEINLQSQLDAPFLLSETPGAVASHFNKVARFDKIDTSTSNVKSWITNLNSEIGHLDTTIEEKTEALKAYDYLEKAEIDLEVLEEMDNKYTTLLQKQTKLETLISNIKDLKSDIKFESEILVYEEPLNTILEDINTLEEATIKQGKLDKVVSTIKQIKKDFLQYSLVLLLEEPLTYVLLLLEDKEKAEEERKRLYRAIQSIKSTTQLLAKATDDRDASVEKFETVFPDICPLCGKPK
jgi:DNA repair protein SbcC/Rad50